MSNNVKYSDFKKLVLHRMVDGEMEIDEYIYCEVVMEGCKKIGVELIYNTNNFEEDSSNYSVLKIEDVLYRVDYQYTSRNGYYLNTSKVRIVQPKEKTILVYE